MSSVDPASATALRERLQSARCVGLALGSGAARGVAHIGVIRALEEQGVKIGCVAGTSMGAFVGSVYAAGQLERLAADFMSFDWHRVASLLDPIFPRSGLIDGQRVEAFLSRYTSRRAIEDLPIPFRAVATDMADGSEIVLGTGDVSTAVRASIAVPGFLTPWRAGERVLLDGGLINPVPVSVVREMGADFVIAVDVHHDVIASRIAGIFASSALRGADAMAERLGDVLHAMSNPAAVQLATWLRRSPMPGILDVLLASFYIMQAQISRANLEHHRPDLTIRPALGAIRFLDFHRAAEMVELGHRAACEPFSEPFSR